MIRRHIKTSRKIRKPRNKLKEQAVLNSLLNPLRVRRARRAAVSAISPLVECSRQKFGAVSDETWSDPYVIGFIVMLITVAARESCRNLDEDSLCLVQILAWQDITSQYSGLIGEEILLLSQTPNAEFDDGCRDGLVLGKLLAAYQARTGAMSAADQSWEAAAMPADPSKDCILATWSQLFGRHVSLHESPLCR